MVGVCNSDGSVCVLDLSRFGASGTLTLVKGYCLHSKLCLRSIVLCSSIRHAVV